MNFSLNETQLSGMWEALTQWGSWLLHVAIQLMPYAIAFTIIMIIFLLIKNWSKLKVAFNKDNINTYRKYKRVFWESNHWSRKDYREWKKRMDWK